MVQITIIDNHTKIETNNLHVYIEGGFEIKKRGAEAPVVNVIAEMQKSLEQ